MHILILETQDPIGKALKQQLLAQGHTLRSTTPQAQPGQLQHVPVAFANPETFAKALAGIEAVYVAAPQGRNPVQALQPFLTYLVQETPVRIVYQSSYLVGLTTLGGHEALETQLRQAKNPWTILRPALSGQDFMAHEKPVIRSRSGFFVPGGEGSHPFVSASDVAACAAKVLTEEGHGGQTYTLTGPEALSYHQVAQQLTGLLKKPIAHINPSPEMYREVLSGAGVPPPAIDHILAVYAPIRANQATTVYPHVQALLARPPETMQAVLAQGL